MYKTEKHTAKADMKSFIEKYMHPEEVLGYCKENHCKHYGSYWACPPYDFDTVDYLKEFSRIEVMGIKVLFSAEEREKKLTPEEMDKVIAESLEEARKELDSLLRTREKQIPQSLALVGGSCILCPELSCTRKEGLPCRHKGEMRYSLESLGAMVADITTDMLGYELKWAKDYHLPEYMSLVGALLIK